LKTAPSKYGQPGRLLVYTLEKRALGTGVCGMERLLWGRIRYQFGMDRDAIHAELLEIEGILLDDRLNDDDRHALPGAAQALRHVLDAATWQPASQTFYRVGRRPSEAGSALVH
jgi:hypothetical protein